MKTWLCSQIGAREHYSIPRALHRQGRLHRLVTDLWFGPAAQTVLRCAGSGGRRLAGRWHADLSKAAVSAFPLNGLRWVGAVRRQSGEQLYHTHVDQGTWFAKRTARLLDTAPQDAVFFSYDTGFLEAGEAARARGIPAAVCQMDPARVEVELVEEEAKNWPGWRADFQLAPPFFQERREREWDIASCVVVNSPWSRDALIKMGVPSEKIAIVPLCFEPPPEQDPTKKPNKAKPLEVLWVGSAILRKGIQYLLEAARLLKDENVRFTVVGLVGITEKAVKTAPPNLQFLGPRPYADAVEHFRTADVFAIPTLSDGFAITQLEAMSYGLPVIATPNCGEVVIEGENGFIIPARDSQALADRIGEWVNDRDLVEKMSDAAKKRAKNYGIDRLTKELEKLENKMMS